MLCCKKVLVLFQRLLTSRPEFSSLFDIVNTHPAGGHPAVHPLRKPREKGTGEVRPQNKATEKSAKRGAGFSLIIPCLSGNSDGTSAPDGIASHAKIARKILLLFRCLSAEFRRRILGRKFPDQTGMSGNFLRARHAVSSYSSRPISQRRISLVPAPIS